jgi:hypothetical protein
MIKNLDEFMQDLRRFCIHFILRCLGVVVIKNRKRRPVVTVNATGTDGVPSEHYLKLRGILNPRGVGSWGVGVGEEQCYRQK